MGLEVRKVRLKKGKWLPMVTVWVQGLWMLQTEGRGAGRQHLVMTSVSPGWALDGKWERHPGLCADGEEQGDRRRWGIFLGGRDHEESFFTSLQSHWPWCLPLQVGGAGEILLHNCVILQLTTHSVISHSTLKLLPLERKKKSGLSPCVQLNLYRKPC